MTESTTVPTDLRPAKTVIYCGICSLPPEYCEYGGTVKKCSEWLLAAHPAMHGRLYSGDAAVAEGLSALSVDAVKRAEKDAKKKAARAEAAEARERETRASLRVVIRRVERNKRKFVTEVSGLEGFGLDLKKIAKEFGKKFATGSSVTKNAGGTGEEITVQGDVAEDIVEWLAEQYGEMIPEENVEVVEDKKKKGAAAAAAA
ncbi:Translation machinery-associated protein 22 [Teratosphaeria destructans]|uniref:Translation machinery-associated protein 22 n=1 Tax=Teratosphaeria destructans TaxID=418781 RepID=A0A9W7SNS0_9PEZI|nr:Translation machinery-associated protein 22 [Teratosphaeria destructans]